jgi:octaprenyl-diphosphate synthase
MVKIIKNEDFTVDEFNVLVELLKKNDGITYTEEKAAYCIEKAKEALSVFEPSKTRETLFDIANYTLARRI